MDTKIRQRDAKPRGSNKSGIPGVSFDNTRNRWRATIGYSGKQIQIGYYIYKVQAVQARHEAEQMYTPGIVTPATLYMRAYILLL